MKKIITLLLTAALLTTGCAAGGDSAGGSSAAMSAPSLPPAAPPGVSQPSSQGSGAESSREESEAVDAGQPEFLAGLLRDEYEGLTISAAILERKAILPGSAIPVTVTIQNNGDSTVVYAQGSGGFTTPQALSSAADGLQPVLPQDYLGVATSDFVTKELKPGEELSFRLYVMAIEENESFPFYTNDWYNESGAYIAEAEWDAIQEKHSDLVPAQPGSYEGHIYFRYHTSAGNPLAEATGYAQADYLIGVSE